MSRHCIHQLKRVHQFTQNDSIQLSRRISTTRALLKDDKAADEKDKKDNEELPEGFFSRFKSELMKDLQADEKNKETLHELQRKSAQIQAQYDKYVGSRLPKSIPVWPRKSDKDESGESEERSTPKISIRERAENLKMRLQKEKLHEDYNNVIKYAKAKSESSYDKMRQWREKPEQKEAQDGEEAVEPPKPNIVQSKFKDLYEKSGIAENPIYQKARAQTTSLLNENKDKFSGVTQAASEVFSKSKELKENLSEQSKAYSEELSKEMSKKMDETKEAVEKSGILERSKEAIEMSKEALEKSEQLAKEAAAKLAKEREELQSSEKFKKVSEATQETLKTAAEDFYDPTRLKESETYRSPEQLKKRIEDEDLEAMKAAEEEKLDNIKINEEATGVTEHKGSKWESNWKNFKEQNPLVQKLMHIRENLEESDNLFARAGYKVFDTFHNIFTGMFQPGEISATTAEIHKIDPNFDLNIFAATLRLEIVPNVLEAYLRSDTEILENWCQERALGQFKHMLAAREFTGTIRLIDIGECDILSGCMLELGPVFMFNVSTQQHFSKTVKVAAVEGGAEAAETVEEDSIKTVNYMIAVCRDQSMLDPTAAWTVLEIVEHVLGDYI